VCRLLQLLQLLQLLLFALSCLTQTGPDQTVRGFRLLDQQLLLETVLLLKLHCWRLQLVLQLCQLLPCWLLPAWLPSWEPGLQQRSALQPRESLLSALQPRESLSLLVFAVLLLLLFCLQLCPLVPPGFCRRIWQLLLPNLQHMG
jgi:hypothetical protein